MKPMQWLLAHYVCDGCLAAMATFGVSFATLVIFLFIIFILSLFALVDGVIAMGLGMAWEIWSPDQILDAYSYWANWTAFRTMMLGLGYYIFMYDPSGSYKPAWMDWMG
jgi:ABC-type sulfate transport system permease component